MARLPQAEIDEMNNPDPMVEAAASFLGFGLADTTILTGWQSEFTGHCMDPYCKTEHAFSIYCHISQANEPGAIPRGKLSLYNNGRHVDVPLDKNQIIELIGDLTEMLNEMP